MSRISVRGFAVASATAVTAVGSVVGVASGSAAQNNDAEATASGTTLLADIPAGEHAQVQTGVLTQQAETMAIAADASARKDAEAAARKAAAETAVAKKKEAEQKERERKEREREEREKEEAQERATTNSNFTVQSSYTVADVQSIARQIVPAGQFQCFSNIVDHESSWNYRATNPSSGAYGLVQALPGSKMASAGADWQTNPATQIKWGLNYMNSRYGSPCGAWEFWQANHWY